MYCANIFQGLTPFVVCSGAVCGAVSLVLLWFCSSSTVLAEGQATAMQPAEFSLYILDLGGQ